MCRHVDTEVVRVAIRRRTVMASAAAGAVELGMVVGVGGPALATDDGDEAKNVILLIGDGMGTTHVTAARHVRYGAAGELVMESLPSHGTVSTWAVQRDSDTPEPVTDSASAATAWASGVKTYNAAIGLDAYGAIVPTMMEQASAAGLRTGNVSTAEITDATPAAQMSHATLRGCQGPEYTVETCETLEGEAYLPIAQQIARNQVADVILGGGNQRFTAEDQQIMKDNGYTTLGAFGETPGATSRRSRAGTSVWSGCSTRRT
jgi:alkaline phosphatase